MMASGMSSEASTSRKGLFKSSRPFINTPAVQFLLTNQLGELFQTTVGVKHGCLLSPVLFNLFLEIIMQEILQDHHTSISIGGRPLCNLQFADDIDLMEGSNNELQDLMSRLTARASAYGMEVSTEKSKVKVNSTNEISVNITMNGEPLEKVASFEYFGATLSKDGTCRAEIHIQIATATAVMARLNSMWKSNISFQTKFQLFRLLVVSILLYRYEAWTLLVDNKRRIQAFETKCLRKLLYILYREHKTRPMTVRSSVKSLMGSREPLLATVSLVWLCHEA